MTESSTINTTVTTYNVRDIWRPAREGERGACVLWYQDGTSISVVIDRREIEVDGKWVKL